MMQMLVAGGIPVLTDDLRKPDADNPRGYYEFERAKAIRTDRAWLAIAEGKVVKMVHLLLLDLPLDEGGAAGAGARRYDIIFMRREAHEVVRSQSVMLARSGKPGGAIAPEQLIAVYERQIARVLGFLAGSAAARVLEVSYNELIREPAATARGIAAFLGGEDGRSMDIAAMAGAVDPTLYRNRAGA